MPTYWKTIRKPGCPFFVPSCLRLRNRRQCIVRCGCESENAESSSQSEQNCEFSKLHELIRNATKVDEELRREMIVVASDIRRALHQRDPQNASRTRPP